MTKRSGHRDRSRDKELRELPEERGGGFDWIPLWGWILIFLVPLVLSEFMFWNVGKIPSMIVFPIAWIGFWYAMMERSGWPILNGRKSKEESVSRDDG